MAQLHKADMGACGRGLPVAGRCLSVLVPVPVPVPVPVSVLVSVRAVLLALVLAAALFLLMALHAGSVHAGTATTGDGFTERFGERQWAGWCEGRDDLGWSFYCDPQEERRKAEDRAQEPAGLPQPPEAQAPPSALETLDGMRAHLAELRAAAILDPSHEKVEAYYREQARFMDIADAFAGRVRRVLWSTPDLDYEAVHPQGNLAKKAVQADLQRTRQTMMATLNRRYGLIYVGTAQCAVCKIYGPHLRRFAADWKLGVLAVSADGSALSGWPEAVPDRGQLAKMQVGRNIVPLTILFDRQTHRPRLLGVGFLSEEEIIYRIHSLTTPAGNTPMATSRQATGQENSQGNGLDRPGGGR